MQRGNSSWALNWRLYTLLPPMAVNVCCVDDNLRIRHGNSGLHSNTGHVTQWLANQLPTVFRLFVRSFSRLSVAISFLSPVLSAFPHVRISCLVLASFLHCIESIIRSVQFNMNRNTKREMLCQKTASFGHKWVSFLPFQTKLAITSLVFVWLHRCQCGYHGLIYARFVCLPFCTHESAPALVYWFISTTVISLEMDWQKCDHWSLIKSFFKCQ